MRERERKRERETETETETERDRETEREGEREKVQKRFHRLETLAANCLPQAQRNLFAPSCPFSPNFLYSPFTLRVCLSVCQSVRLSHLKSVPMSLSGHLPHSMSIQLSICLFICLSIYKYTGCFSSHFSLLIKKIAKQF